VKRETATVRVWPALGPLLDAHGPLAVVDLETTGLPERRSAHVIEFAAALIDPENDHVETLSTLVRPKGPLPAAIRRLTGLTDRELADAPGLGEVAPAISEALRGRTIIAHNAPFERHFLAKDIDRALQSARYLDTQDLLGLTHPDAKDQRLESFTQMLLGRPEQHRALSDVLDTLEILVHLAEGAADGRARYVHARRALDRFAPESGWRPLLGVGFAPPTDDTVDESAFVAIGETDEAPVPFDEAAIAAALGDEARGRRAFATYRVRHEQIELARAFARNLARGETLLIEGGTGVGKSLAYLAAAIPFVMDARAGKRKQPVIISTRTKLLQDQLLGKDIAAAARFLGWPGLKAISIKGRANYVCERRLADTLAEGRDPELFVEERLTYSTLLACARNRPHGEVGTLPAALHFRHPRLRELVRNSVAARAEQCSREDCAKHPSCPFGLRRASLAKADLVVANHDLLLRWPPDYPSFGHVIVDEGHELAGVADEVYAQTVRPEEIIERLDETFGAPSKMGLERDPGSGMLPRKQRMEAAKEVRELRRALLVDLSSLGRSMADHAGDFGELELPALAEQRHPEAANVADACAARLEHLAGLAERLEDAAEWSFDEEPTAGDSESPIRRHAEAWRGDARALRLAFLGETEGVVAGFSRLTVPYDRWTLALRAVAPGEVFHTAFMEGLDSFAAVSASLFIDGDEFAALGELEIDAFAGRTLRRVRVASPFDHATHLRVAALEGRGELEFETAKVIEALARRLGGRTLGLFTSLRRMNAVADRLAAELAGEEIEVLAPRRAGDDPASLVERFRTAPGGAVLLGARTFWQGLDLPGDHLQAVVIEKLPFEVPTELRKRREHRVREGGGRPFERYTLGKMLLYLKQMAGRLIRTESDRGVVVIVEGRTDRGYFRQLRHAFPEGVEVRKMQSDRVVDLLDEVGLPADPLTDGDSES